MRKYFLMLLVITTLALAELRQANDPYEYALGARSVGMGRTVVAVGNDVQAVYANPAVVNNIDKLQMGLLAFKLFDEYNYISLNSVIPTRFGPIGISYLSLSVDDIPQTYLVQEGSEVRILSDDVYAMGDRVLGLTYGLPGPRQAMIFKNVDFGITAKIANSYINGVNTDSSSVNGFGLDAGVKFDLTVLEGFHFGAAYQNLLAPKFQTGDETDANNSSSSGSEYVGNLRLGVAKDFVLAGQRFIGAADYDNNGGHLGLEYQLDKSFMFRAGMDGPTTTFGLGIKMFSFYGFDYRPYTFALDYAYHIYPEPLDNLHLFSVSMLGVTQTKKPAIETVFNQSVISTNAVLLQGTAEPGSEVVIYVNNRVRKVTKAEDSGVWAARDVYLDNGKNNVYITAQYEQYVVSEPSDQLNIYSDQLSPEIQANVVHQGDSLLVTAKANKKMKVVVSKMPDEQKLLLTYDETKDVWSGTWKIPANFSNTYLHVQTMGIDNNENKTEMIENIVSTRFVDYPLDKTIVTDKSITVKGTVPANVVKVLVQNNLVEPDSKGQFSVPVTLNNVGKNIVEVVALDADNNRITSDLRVLRVQESEDVSSVTWAKKEISDLLTLGFVDLRNQNANEFRPRDYITRGEFAKALSLIRGLPQAKATNLATDIRNDNEYALYINAVLTAGYMTTEGKGEFSPSAFILKKDAVTAIVKMEQLNVSKIDRKRFFADIPYYMPYAPYVAAALNAGIISLEENFYPDKELTRVDAAVMLSRSKYVRPKVKDLYDWTSGYGQAFAAPTSGLLDDLYSEGKLISFPKADQKLMVVAPLDQTFVSQDVVTVKGLFKDGDSVKINGQSVPVKNTVFVADVKLKLGKNYIAVEGGTEKVILRIINLLPFSDLANNKQNLPYNILAQYNVFAEGNTLDKQKILLRSELQKILAALQNKQPEPVPADGNVAWQEALDNINAFDNKPAGDQTLVQDIKGYDPKASISRDDFLKLLLKTKKYNDILNNYLNFENYSQEGFTPDEIKDRSGDIPQASLKSDNNVAFNFSGASATGDSYLGFLSKYEGDNLISERKVERTGESILAGGESTFEITSPENHFVIAQADLKIAGVSVGNGDVKINGKKITLDAKGNFQHMLLLDPGKNIIKIQTTQGGNYILRGIRLLSFQDIGDLKEKKLIEYLATVGYFKEGPNFYPAQNVSREEFAALLVRMSNETPVQVFRNPFPDVDAKRWSAPSIQLLKDKGILSGNGDFNPTAALTQKEASLWFQSLSSGTLPGINDNAPLQRIDVVKWLIKDNRVQAQILNLRE